MQVGRLLRMRHGFSIFWEYKSKTPNGTIWRWTIIFPTPQEQ